MERTGLSWGHSPSANLCNVVVDLFFTEIRRTKNVSLEYEACYLRFFSFLFGKGRGEIARDSKRNYRSNNERV